MNEGYKQASEISRNLILTFVFGIIIGTVIGWGARSTVAGKVPEAPPEMAVTADATPGEAPSTSTPEPAPATAPAPEPAVTPASNPATDANGPPFDPDVTGLWPAGHLFTGIKGTKADVDTVEWLHEFKPGGVVLGPENVTDPLQLADLVLQIKQAVGLGTKITDPPFILFDDPDRALPRILSAEGDGKSPDAAATQAREALKQGVGAFLGPDLDVFIAGVSEPRLEAASLGAGPDAVSGPGLDYANQLVKAGLMALARDFPGAGLAVKTEEGIWHIPADQMDALANAMQPFKSAMDAGIPGIVVGQMAIPGIDADRPKRPAALSPKLLQLLVREDWKYNGLLIAGDITRHPMTRELPRDEIALKALFSGCDAVILKDVTGADLRTICETFVRLSARSDFPSVQLAASRQRLKDALGRLGSPTDGLLLPPVKVAEVPATPAPAEGPATPAPVLPVPPVTPAEASAPQPAPSPTPESAPTPAPAETPAPTSATPPVSTEAPAPAAPAEAPAPTPTETPAPPAPAEVPAPAPAEATPPAPAPVEAPATPPAEAPAAAPVVEAAVSIVAPPAPEATPAKPREHTIAKGDSLNALARHYGVTVADLRTWNGMESDVVKIGQVLKLEAPVADTKSTEAKPEKAAEAAPADAGAAKETVSAAQPPDTDKREHSVAAGETLGSIAGMYGVSVAEIQAWNNLDPGETVINAGAALVLYLPVAVQEEGKAAAEKAAAPEKPEATPPLEPGTFEIYEVSQGDNLRRIAQRFGTTQQKLMEMNNLKSADLVQLGWKLKVPKQAAPLSGSTP